MKQPGNMHFCLRTLRLAIQSLRQARGLCDRRRGSCGEMPPSFYFLQYLRQTPSSLSPGSPFLDCRQRKPTLDSTASEWHIHPSAGRAPCLSVSGFCKDDVPGRGKPDGEETGAPSVITPAWNVLASSREILSLIPRPASAARTQMTRQGQVSQTEPERVGSARATIWFPHLARNEPGAG